MCGKLLKIGWYEHYLEKKKIEELKLIIYGSIIGSETTSITIQWMCAILAHYPEVQDKAFAEIERVVGRNRLPTDKDGK